MSTNLLTRYRRVAPRATMLFAAGALLALSCSFGSPAAGAATTTSTPTSVPGAPGPTGGHEVLNGITAGPAVVTTPGKPTRRLTADQNTAFLQTWMGASIATHLPPQRPPACLPISQMLSSITASGITSRMIVYYATDGATAWVGMPRQALSFASVTKETWIASPRSSTTIAAFAGQVASIDITTDQAPAAAAPDPTATTVVCAAATNSPPRHAAATKSSSSSSTWLWFVIPAAVIVVGLGAWLLTRSRTRTA